MYVDGIRHFLFLISRHNFNASPRANRSRYQKSPGNFSSPVSWDHVDQVWRQSRKKPMTSISNSRACAFYITLNSWLPDGRSLWHAIRKLFGTMRSITAVIHLSYFSRISGQKLFIHEPWTGNNQICWFSLSVWIKSKYLFVFLTDLKVKVKVRELNL